MKSGIIFCLMLVTASGLFAQKVTTTTALTTPESNLTHENTSGIEGTYIDSVTVGGGTLMGGSAAGYTVMPYYVTPDMDLNPDYDPASADDASNLNSQWTWGLSDDLSGSVSIVGATYPSVGVSTDLNQIFLQFDATAGLFNLNVQEYVPLSGGVTCPGATRTIKIQTVAVPTADTVDVANVAFCSSTGTTTKPKFKVTGYPPFKIRISRTVSTLGAGGAYTNVAGWTNSDTTIVSNVGVTTTATSNPNEYTIELASIQDSYLQSYNSKVTKIEYTILGVNDKISRKSDRNATDVYYEGTGESIVYYAYPTPDTGDIRSVANN